MRQVAFNNDWYRKSAWKYFLYGSMYQLKCCDYSLTVFIETVSSHIGFQTRAKGELLEMVGVFAVFNSLKLEQLSQAVSVQIKYSRQGLLWPNKMAKKPYRSVVFSLPQNQGQHHKCTLPLINPNKSVTNRLRILNLHRVNEKAHPQLQTSRN